MTPLATYPKPATPLPWHYGITLVTADCDYVVHAANAFPHLVAALEMIQAAQWLRPAQRKHVAIALAIARGETPP